MWGGAAAKSGAGRLCVVRALCCAILMGSVFSIACSRKAHSGSELESHDASRVLAARPEYVDEMFAPLPEERSPPDARIKLGARIFNEVKLSGDGRVSCASCHSLTQGGANAQQRSALPDRKPVVVNVPTVFNMAYNFRFSWSGKFVDVGQPLDTAMGLKDLMATTWEDAARRFAADATYGRDFGQVYADGVTAANVRDALVRYCLSLTTPGARFDEFLRGRAALSEQENRGYTLFREYGCVSCHQGMNIGGNMHQKFGVMRDYFAERGNVTQADYGLYNQTKREEDRYVFRVPSLRNVALTAPYFHDGSALTLEEAVQTMARYQLGRELTRDQTTDIVAFLTTLTGQMSWEDP